LKKLKRGDIALFFMENGAIIPCILAKILGITTVKLLPSGIAHSGWQEMPSISSGLIYGLYVFENPWFDKIGIYGPNLITEWNLEYIYKKILIISEHLVDTNEFNIKIEYSSRPNYIAYIGRFSLEKGICNFLSSLPQIIAVNDEIGIWIIGDGELKDEVTSYLRRNSSYANIELLPWAEHRMLPAILNTIRLVVIPSYTEGLPNLLLEAMACGTPAIVSSVGIIPSIIIDDVNGYTLENNRPESIAYTVTKALQKKDMEVIAMKARKTIEDNFAKEVVTKKWEDLLRNLR
jgi:glycosyltransferase involved in cell wall biosynthesis